LLPQDWHEHNCIRLRSTTSTTYRWEFEKNSEQVEILVEGSIIINNLDLVACAALGGPGIGSPMVESCVAPFIAFGRLVPVLED
jgi:DNA-binding transcriptional LysR family regulator